MSPTADDQDASAGEYVLGLLDPAAAPQIEQQLRSEPAMRAAVARWRERLLELDGTVLDVPPSSSLWARIEASLSGQPSAAARAIPRSGVLQGLWGSLPVWRTAGLAGAALSAALALALLVVPRTAQPVVIAVLLSSDAKPGAIVEVFDGNRTVVVPLVEIPVPEGRALQVWTLPDPAKGPVSLGLLPAAQRASLDGHALPSPRQDQLYEITLEPRSGSPTGRPTGPILFKGFATAPRT